MGAEGPTDVQRVLLGTPPPAPLGKPDFMSESRLVGNNT